MKQLFDLIKNRLICGIFGHKGNYVSIPMTVVETFELGKKETKIFTIFECYRCFMIKEIGK